MKAGGQWAESDSQPDGAGCEDHSFDSRTLTRLRGEEECVMSPARIAVLFLGARSDMAS